MEKVVFSRRKYLDSMVNSFSQIIKYLEPKQIYDFLKFLKECYTGWVLECDGLTIEECRALGYYVSRAEWFDVIS